MKLRPLHYFPAFFFLLMSLMVSSLTMSRCPSIYFPPKAAPQQHSTLSLIFFPPRPAAAPPRRSQPQQRSVEVERLVVGYIYILVAVYSEGNKTYSMPSCSSSTKL
jgi:hypothetical protein